MQDERPNRTRLDAFRYRLAGADALPQLAILGILAGFLTGLVIVLFRGVVHLTLEFALPEQDSENFEDLSALTRFALPAVGALAIGGLLTLLPRATRSVGVVHVMERLSRHQGHLPVCNAMTQFVAGTLGLLTGQSGGREGPAIHLGSATSSLLGQALALPNNSIRLLVGCGTAAAIAGSFNTPLAGVVFAMEVVLLEYTIASFIPVILAAVTATLLGQLAFGDHTAFDVPDAIRLHGIAELPFVLALGLLVGALAAAFIWLCKHIARIDAGPLWVRIASAGVLTGAVAIALPQVMGVGYDTVEAALDGKLSMGLLAAIALAKLATAAVTTGLRVPVGIIGPTLVIGAAAGGAFGLLFSALFPASAPAAELSAMLGMGAMMGATLHAPLAALLAVIELTGNPTATMPAMLAIVVATITARTAFRQRGVFIELLARRGIDDDGPLQNAHLDRIGVASVMTTRIASLPPVTTIDSARNALAQNPEWIVVEGPRGPHFVLNPSDLELAVLNRVTRTDTIAPDIDLREIPALRLDVVSVDVQATLREAATRVLASNAEALCVRRVVAPLVAPTVGVVTRETCSRLVRIGD